MPFSSFFDAKIINEAIPDQRTGKKPALIKLVLWHLSLSSFQKVNRPVIYTLSLLKSIYFLFWQGYAGLLFELLIK